MRPPVSGCARSWGNARVRRLPGHSAPITDLAFSPDSRWLVTVSLDSTGRVWDLPTGHCVDYVLFDSPATSVDLSPSSDMMATSHTGDLGVYLWLNKTLYQQTTLAPHITRAPQIPQIPQNPQPLQAIQIPLIAWAP